MSWFQLDPASLASRNTAPVPTLGAFLRRGLVGFTLLSVAGFAPWALGGSWFYRSIGEGGLYAVCALVFIGLSAPLLHRLILGAGSFVRFYLLFAVAFSGYAIAWIVGWMVLRGHLGSAVGLLAGAAVFAGILATAFEARSAFWKVLVVLFFANAAGYFIGGVVEASAAQADGILSFVADRKTRLLLAKLSWGVCYGAGFGAGLGYAFYECQAGVRAILAGTNPAA